MQSKHYLDTRPMDPYSGLTGVIKYLAFEVLLLLKRGARALSFKPTIHLGIHAADLIVG